MARKKKVETTPEVDSTEESSFESTQDVVEETLADNPQVETPVVVEQPPFDDDDELALAALKDEKLELKDDYAVFKQQEGMIAWSLENFYREDGTVRSKKELRLDPPVLRVESSEGQSVDFILTKGFTKSMKDGLDDVYRGMFGVHKSRAPLSSFKEALYNSVMENPLRVIVLTALALFCVVLAIFF